MLELSGPLTDQQRQELLNVAMKCPVHRLMTQTTVEVKTELQPASV
jgi:putative redox protein